jgi:hypothetical protein
LKYKAKLRARVEADSIEAEAKSISDMEAELAAEAKAAKAKAARAAKAKVTKSAKVTKAKVTKATKAKASKSETTKTKEKTACQYCEKPYVFIAKHEAKCSKKPQNDQDSSENESIAIKA